MPAPTIRGRVPLVGAHAHGNASGRDGQTLTLLDQDLGSRRSEEPVLLEPRADDTLPGGAHW